ncbi:MAG: M15 family metallopeptidase [Methylocystaceae bacterium]
MAEMLKDLDYLHPTLKKKAEMLIEKCIDHQMPIVITETLRAESRQNDLYAQGRSGPRKHWKRVTNARYPQSLHSWGLAFDFAVLVDGKVNWQRLDLYDQVGHLGESLGLEWGGRWKRLADRPHFQLPGFEWLSLVRQYSSPDFYIRAYGGKPIR